jgi:two-component system NtrC family sensor kinase
MSHPPARSLDELLTPLPAAAPSSGDTPRAESRFDVLALAALGHDIAGAASAERVVERMSDALRRLIAPDRLVVVLLEPEGRGRVMAALNAPDARPDDPLVSLALEAGPLLISDHVAEALAVRGITNPGAVPGSWIGAPLVAGQPLGAISVSSATPGRFTNETLALVRAVAAPGAVAIQSARVLTALSHGKREWEQTVDAITQGICVVDAAGVIRRANRTFCAMVDVPLTAVAGRPLMALVPPTWTDAITAALQAPQGAEPHDVPAGDRLFRVSSLPLHGAGAAHAVLIFDDHTATRRLQEQLIQSEKMSAIGQLIAGVAHDLNNPLASVVGFADYLVENAGTAPPELIEPLRAIQQEAERAANIVKNLLGFARKQERRRQLASVRDLVSSTLLLLRNQLVAGKIETELDLDPGVPDVCVDANQIRQVFVNLINNAAQAIELSGMGSRILIRARSWLDGVAVTVEDDGPGIPSHLTERIFEPFFTTKSAGEGTGLGLSISHGIVKEHGGRLTYVPAARRGAVFQVELPAGTPAVKAPTRPTPVPRGLKVLVIDDEPHIQHYMTATLESWGHQVVVASNGAEGLAHAARQAFDLIVSDLRMPELGGREMFERLTRDQPAVAQRVVFSTGDTVRGDTLAFLESLGRPYLRKPFTLGELRAVLADAVQPRYES